jgi:hypothetical protein
MNSDRGTTLNQSSEQQGGIRQDNTVVPIEERVNQVDCASLRVLARTNMKYRRTAEDRSIENPAYDVCAGARRSGYIQAVCMTRM